MIGTKIGQYRVLQLLGEGGMGRVLLAEHVLMKTRHAIKLLHDQLSKNEQIVQRFINEARAAGAIGHRNVVEITHVDQVEGGGPWYLVMKYLEGQTLTGLLASRKAPVEQRLIVHILGEALNGLQAAHDRQIIHRDLKPDNLYLTTAKGDPYRTILLDFGVAQLGHDAGVVTRTGAVIGTPHYMAPEQHRGAAITERVDIWAMGAIAYEMATGRLPYQDDSDERSFLTGAEIFHRMMTRPVVDPRYFNPAITEAFARTTLMALELDPARRSLSARALALMLAEATPGDGFQPSGLELLKTHADELLDGDPRLATVRFSVPSLESSTGHAPGPPLVGPPQLVGQLPGGQQPLVGPPQLAGTPPMGQPPVGPPPLARMPPVGPPLRGQPAIGQPLAGPLLPVPEPVRPIEQGSGAHPERVAAQLAGPVAPMSTLGAMASQSFPTAQRGRSRRSWLIAGIGVVAAGTVGAGVVATQRASATTPDGEARLGSSETAPGPIHVPMPVPTNPGAEATIVSGLDAGLPDSSKLAANPTSAADSGTADAGPIDAPALAARSLDAGAPDSAKPAAAPASAVDARPADPPALATHANDAKLPGNDSKPVRSEPAATGAFRVVILPWAEVWIDGKAFGQTPVGTRLSVGTHRVRLKNDAREKTVTVTVTAARPTVIDETW